jgi:hypothetical protein
MKKLSLDLDALDVESFATDTARRQAGTVHGYITIACGNTPNGTCDNTCQCSNQCNTWDTACGGDTGTCTKDQTCNCPTVIGYSCEYDTCNLPNCTGPATCQGC